MLAVLGITLVGESLNDLADPRLRGRRRVAQSARQVAETSVVPGGTLDRRTRRDSTVSKTDETFDEHGIEVKPMSTVVDIRNLGVSFATDAGAVKAVDDVSPVGRTRRGARHRRRVRQRQDRHGQDDPRPAARDRDDARGGDPARSKAARRESDVISVSKQQLRDIRGTDVAMVFQEPSTALNPVYTVGWQIAEGLRAHGDLSKKEARAKAIEILGRVGIPDPEMRVDHYPHQFSGGQKQRVVIAMALVLDPGLIVADEPTTALDVTVQAEILDLLRRCRDEFGTAIVLITHNMGVVADLADRVAVMYQGKVVEQADAHDAVRRTRRPTTPRRCSRPCRTSARAPRGPPHGRRHAPTDWARADAGRRGRRTSRSCTRVASVAPGFTRGRRRRLRDPARRGARAGRRVAVRARPRSAARSPGLTKVTGGSLQGARARDERHPRARRSARSRSRIGFVFQDPASSFNPLLTIAECVAEPLVIHGRASDAPRRARQRVDELLEAVQLPSRLRRPLPARALAAASGSARASRARSRSSPSC